MLWSGSSVVKPSQSDRGARFPLKTDLHVRFTGLKRDLDQYTRTYDHDRPHHGRLTAAASPQTSSTVPAK